MSVNTTGDDKTVEQAVEAFHNLSAEDTAKLKDLNTRIQNHEGEWGVRGGGEKIAENTFKERWVQNDPLSSGFIDFMYDKDLLPVFSWTGEDEVSKLFVSEDQTKYDDVDLETALKLVYIVTRKERFASGSLAWAFESGGFPKLVNRLVELKEVVATKPE
jgi:hypothetical protein